MYRIESVQLDKYGTKALFLVSESGHNFWSEWAKKKATKATAVNFASLIFRVQEKGLSWAIQTSKLRVIDGNLKMVEIKNFDGVWRVLCYMDETDLDNAIMLKRFRGHQGSNRIPPEILKQGKHLAEIAENILKEEKNHDNLT